MIQLSKSALGKLACGSPGLNEDLASTEALLLDDNGVSDEDLLLDC
jgi:hypothetical protein